MRNLNEATRQELITKTKKSDRQKDGHTRFTKRLRSTIASSNTEYNKIDMNKFFEKDILSFKIPVKGETNNYLVTLQFNGVLEELSKIVEKEEDISPKTIQKSIGNVFTKKDIYVGCSCPDYRYRQAYHATQQDYNALDPEDRPSNITNPNDTKGGGCKHIALVLNNMRWLLKVVSVIKNYIAYIKKNYQELYADIIYPAIFKKEYEKPVQLRIDKDIDSEPDIVDRAMKSAREKGQFTTDTAPRWKFINPEDEEKQLRIEK